MRTRFVCLIVGMCVAFTVVMGFASARVMRKMVTSYWIERYLSLVTDDQADQVSIAQFDLCCQHLDQLHVSLEDLDHLVHLADRASGKKTDTPASHPPSF